VTRGERSALSPDVDALFKLPLGEFTAGRNALVAQLKKAGRHAEANEVKALAKPSISAWVVNEIYWRHRKLFDRLIEAGDRLRRVPTGDAARNAANARRETLTELQAIAAATLRDGNYGATLDMLRRVARTLEALSSYGSLPGAPAAGRLSDDVDAPGFEAVARKGRLTLSPPRPEPAAAPVRSADQGHTAARRKAEKRKEVAAAKGAVREAERTLRVARKQAERAAATSAAAATHAKKLDERRAQLEKQLARAAKETAEAQVRAHEAQANAAEATAAVDGAERALGVARRRAQEIAGGG
jgi:hypothetical protein